MFYGVVSFTLVDVNDAIMQSKYEKIHENVYMNVCTGSSLKDKVRNFLIPHSNRY